MMRRLKQKESQGDLVLSNDANAVPAVPEAVPSVIPKINPDLLPDLDEYELKFVENVSRGMSHADAYQRAYEKSRHRKVNVKTGGYTMSLRPNVSAWLTVMKEAKLHSYLQTAELYAAEVRSVMEKCMRIGDMRGAVKALELLGKTEGHFDKNVVSIEQGDDGELIKRIELSLGRNAAEAAKERLGIGGGNGKLIEAADGN